MARLILVRHARSEWNALGIWTGWRDVGLADTAEEEVAELARKIQGLQIDRAYSSTLRRAKETLALLQRELSLDLPIEENAALNERNYGIYTGRNKWDVRDEMGEEAFLMMRRGWDVSVPEGETLKDVYERIMPFYEEVILSDLQAGKNVLIVAHGNSLRALIKYLENVGEDDIADISIGVADAHIYDIDETGMVRSREVYARGGLQV